MIELHTWRTANGRKVSIMLEECGLPYRVHAVDITVGEQKAPAFLSLNPNGRIPVIVDPDGPGGAPCTVFESGAILIYLAEKCGRFLAPEPRARMDALQWLMFQMGGIGPMFGQAFHFAHQHPAEAPAEALAYGRARYGGETQRLCAVLDKRLGASAFLAGAYSIADMATFPWIALHGWLGIDLAAFPSVLRWYAAIKDRPAVRRGMDVPPRPLNRQSGDVDVRPL